MLCKILMVVQYEIGEIVQPLSEIEVLIDVCISTATASRRIQIYVRSPSMIRSYTKHMLIIIKIAFRDHVPPKECTQTK